MRKRCVLSMSSEEHLFLPGLETRLENSGSYMEGSVVTFLVLCIKLWMIKQQKCDWEYFTLYQEAQNDFICVDFWPQDGD